MKAKRLTPSPFDLPVPPAGSPIRPSVVALIRQHLACGGSRKIDELRRNLDASITEAEQMEALSRRQFKNRVVRNFKSESGGVRGRNWL